jgi:hypothetical protein
VLTLLQNVPDTYEIGAGVSRTEGFPENALWEMNPEFPKDVRLADNLDNLESMIVVSKRLKEHVEAAGTTAVEFLPVALVNHKGRVASRDYFIINPLHVVDCIDREQSKIEWNGIDPEAICSCFGLVLLADQIDESIRLFRLKHMPKVVMVREDLADSLMRAGFTGLRFVPVEEFEL